MHLPLPRLMHHLRIANGPNGPRIKMGHAAALLTTLLLTPNPAREENDAEVDKPCSVQILFDPGGGKKCTLVAGLLRSRTRPLEWRRLETRVG